MTCSNAAPTGTVTFKDGKTALGTASLASGQVQFTTSTLVTGTHNVIAMFGGSKNFAKSTSSSLREVIN